MRILITGSRGMVGKALCTTLSKDYTLVTPTRAQLNIGNFEQVMKFNDVDFIIHLAGETDHEYCEQNPSNCYYINTVGTGNMVRLARTLDIPIVYISTASIFDGTKGMPYTTFDPPNPINHYNTSKHIIRQDPTYGTYNCTNRSSGGVGRYEFGKKVIQHRGLSNKVRSIP